MSPLQTLAAWLEEAGAQEAIFVRRAYRDNLRNLSDELSARKPARESREASLKLGRRFAQLVNSIAGTQISADLHYSVAFGSATSSVVSSAGRFSKKRVQMS